MHVRKETACSASGAALQHLMQNSTWQFWPGKVFEINNVSLFGPANLLRKVLDPFKQIFWGRKQSAGNDSPINWYLRYLFTQTGIWPPVQISICETEGFLIWDICFLDRPSLDKVDIWMGRNGKIIKRIIQFYVVLRRLKIRLKELGWKQQQHWHLNNLSCHYTTNICKRNSDLEEKQIKPFAFWC